MNKTIGYLFTLSAILLSVGCATIVHGSRQSIGIASNPSNAHVWVDGWYMGTSPVIVDMSRKTNHYLRIELEGFEPYEAAFTKQMSGWVFGNLVFGGVIGVVVDVISGGIYQLTPEQIQAEMRTNHVYKPYSDNNSYIGIVLTPNSSWVKVGNLKKV